MPLQPPPIQYRPPGLLQLLGIQNGGQAPNQLLPHLSAVMDLGDWYLRSQQREAISSAQPITVAGFNTSTLIVPQSEQWYFHFLGCSILTAAGNSIGVLSLAFETPTTAIFVSESSDLQLASTNRQLTQQQSFWAPPGSRIGVYVQDLVLATAVFSLRAIVTKVQV